MLRRQVVAQAGPLPGTRPAPRYSGAGTSVDQPVREAPPGPPIKGVQPRPKAPREPFRFAFFIKPSY